MTPAANRHWVTIMVEVITEVRIEDVPDDFPRVARLGAVAGAQPKLLMTQYEGKFYELGLSPPEVYERWLNCEDLAQQLSQAAMPSKLGKRAHMTEEEILAQYVPRLKAQGWGAPEEMEWVANRAGVILGWRPAA